MDLEEHNAVVCSTQEIEDTLTSLCHNRKQLIKAPWSKKKREYYFEALSHDSLNKMFLTLSAIKDSPIVSVIIPCFNYAKYLEECINSITEQTFDNYEIIIVNDGSTDNFNEVTDKIILRNNKKRITIINQQNSGQPAIARNNGIKKSKGKYILCLDADDKIHSNFLEECVNVLYAHTEYSIAYPNIQHFGKNTSLLKFDDYDASLITLYNHIPTASLFKKKAWIDSGGYKANVKGYEDWDFWIGCYEAGHIGKHADKAIFHYRIHDGGNMLKDANSRDQILKSQIILNHKDSYNSEQIHWAKEIKKSTKVDLIKDLGLGLMPSFSQNFKNNDLNNENRNLTKLTKPEKNIHCVFIIENLMGITGGNITLKKLVQNLIGTKFKNININTYCQTRAP